MNIIQLEATLQNENHHNTWALKNWKGEIIYNQFITSPKQAMFYFVTRGIISVDSLIL
jgi:hypothetical protein